METRQMTPCFLSTFSTLTVCNIFVFENAKIIFHVVPPLVHSSL